MQVYIFNNFSFESSLRIFITLKIIIIEVLSLCSKSNPLKVLMLIAKENCRVSAFSDPFSWLLFAFISSNGASDVKVIVPVRAENNRLGALT